MSQYTKTKGKYYEEIAEEYLCNLGFTFIQKNYYTKYGEIDLVMQKDNILHFVEVKSAINMNPLLNITPRKIERLIKAIKIFLANNSNMNMDFCLDAIGFYNGKIIFTENILL